MSRHYGKWDAIQFMLGLVGDEHPDYDLERAVNYLWSRGRTYDIQDCDNETLRAALEVARRKEVA